MPKQTKCRGKVTLAEAKQAAQKIGVDWEKVAFKPLDLKRGMKVELEHGRCIEGKPSPATNVTDDNLIKTAKIALAHLKEDFRYYSPKVGLLGMEKRLEKTHITATKSALAKKSHKKT